MTVAKQRSVTVTASSPGPVATGACDQLTWLLWHCQGIVLERCLQRREEKTKGRVTGAQPQSEGNELGSCPPPQSENDGARVEKGPEGCWAQGTWLPGNGRGSEGCSQERQRHTWGSVWGGTGLLEMGFAQGPRHSWVTWVPEWGFDSQGKNLKLGCCDTCFSQLHLILEAILNKNGQGYECPSDCYIRALQRGQLKHENNP